MRVLFSCVAAYGHFHPLVPLARAFADDGHDVAFATAAAFRDRVDEAGFELVPAGLGQDELNRRFAPYRERLLELPPTERRPFNFTWRFANIDAPSKLTDLRAAADSWRPDVVIHEPTDLAAPLVAAHAELPSIQHNFGRAIPLGCFELSAREMAPLWRELGLEPDPLCGAFRGAYVDICPPGFQTTNLPAGARVELERPTFPATSGAPPPPWLAGLRGRPTAYVTLGTVHNDVSLLRLLLESLGELELDVVMTTGRDVDLEALRPFPSNAIVEQYVPQGFILPQADVVVAHGGSGSILATFAHGLPTLLVPQAADQFENALRCAELGAGLVLMPDEVTADAVRAAVETLLAEASYRDRALELAAEIAAMPEPREVALRLAAMAA